MDLQKIYQESGTGRSKAVMRGLYEVRFDTLMTKILVGRLTKPGNIMTVSLKPDRAIAVDKSQLTEENRKMFIELMSLIPRISRGLSYLQMVGHPKLDLTPDKALMAQGVGRAFELWNLLPMDMRVDKKKMAEIYEEDVKCSFPANTGLGNGCDTTRNGSVA